MSFDKPHLYVGSAKEVIRDGREPYLRVEIDLGDLREKLEEQHKRVWTAKDGTVHKVVTLIVAPMKPENRTEYKTHSVKIDTWKPDPQYREKRQTEGQYTRRPGPAATTTDRLPDDDDGGADNVPF